MAIEDGVFSGKTPLKCCGFALRRWENRYKARKTENPEGPRPVFVRSIYSGQG